MKRLKSLVLIVILNLIICSKPTIAQDAGENASPEGLKILALSPAPDASDVNPNGLQITLSFDRSVVSINELAVPSISTFLDFEPDIEGTGEWVHPAVYVFTPNEDAVTGGIQYRLSVQEAIVALDGTSLELPFEWSFETIQPQVIEILPTQTWDESVLLDSGFRVSFSQAMEHASTEAAFSLLEYVGDDCYDGCSNNPEDWASMAGSFVWDADSKAFTFTPDEALDYANPYRNDYLAVLNTTALSQDGLATLQETVSTYVQPVPRPAVVSISPTTNEAIAPGMQTVLIDFIGAMNTESYRDHYTVSPTPPGEITPYVNEDGSLRLVFEHVVDTDYTITILPGIEDIYGTAIEEAVSVTYRVREPQPEHYLRIASQDFVIAGTYLDNPAIPLRIRGEVNVNARIYQADLAMLFEVKEAPYPYYSSYGGTFDLGRFYAPQPISYCCDFAPLPDFDLPWLQAENLLMRTSASFESDEREGEVFYMPLLAENAEPLPMGIYGVDINEETGFVLAVANTNITVKRSSDEILVWLTDFVTAEPVSNLSVTLHSNSQNITATSDAEGLARFAFTEPVRSFVFITAESQERFGIWYSSGGVRETETRIYLYTDRPIYRPGEPIHYRGIMREGEDLNYTLPDNASVYVNLQTLCYDYYCESTSIYEAERALSEFGSFSDSFNLPAELVPGQYRLEVSTCPPESENCENGLTGSVIFSVAEFRVPDFTVELTPQHEEVLSGEPLNVDVFASYYFGGAVAAGTISRYGHGGTTAFVYRGAEMGYRFGDTDAYSRAELYRPGESFEIEASGHYLLNDAVVAEGSFPVLFNLEATVIDSSGQSITGRNSLIIHPANLYIGLRPSSITPELNTNVQLDIISVYPDSSPRANEILQLEIVEQRYVRVEESFGEYRWTLQTFPIASATIVSDATGHASYQFLPPYAGNYRIRLMGTDEAGRIARTALTIRVPEANPDSSDFGEALLYYYSCQPEETTVQLRLTGDKESYLPGDTAIIRFMNPYEQAVNALITIERNGIREVEVKRLEAGLNSYNLLLDSDDAPNIHFSLVLIRPIVSESTLPQFLLGDYVLLVDNLERRLNIDIQPSTLLAEPGQEVSFDFYVTDSNGEAVSAEIGLGLTDEAVLALTSSSDWNTLENHFYPHQHAGVVTRSAGVALLQDVPIETGSQCGYGGGGGSGIGILRDDFIYTPLWEPHLVTDENGFASVSVVMPSNVTSWRLDARAITADTDIGQATTEIVSSLPLIVRAIAPRFFVVGDYLPLAAIVHNNTDESLQVAVQLEQEGLSLDDNAIRHIEVPAHGMLRVEWWGRVNDVEGVYMAVSAVADNGLSDASIPTLTTGENNTIPVYDFTATEIISTTGILESAGSATEAIDLRLEPLPQSINVNVQLQSSLSLSLLETALNLPESSDISNGGLAHYLHIYAALASVYSTEPALMEQIQELLPRVAAEQNSDGGWGWYDDFGSELMLTADMLISLHEVEALGIEIDASIIESASNYLKRYLSSPSVNTPANQLNWQANIRYALALHGQIELESLEQLYPYRLEMSIPARAQLLMAYLVIAPEAEAVAALESDLISLAIVSATGVHWEESLPDYRFSNSQATSFALLALIKAEADFPLAPDVINWLMLARSGDSWRSTSENRWAIVAISAWTQQQGDLQADYDFSLSLNENPLADGSFEIGSENQSQIWNFGMSDLLPNQLNLLHIERSEGTGSLYYSTVLELSYRADEVAPIERGLRIEREYLRDSDRSPIESARLGEIVVVRLTLYVSESVHYFSLEDKLPAGLEAIDVHLLTSDSSAGSPRLSSVDRNNRYWYWGLYYWGKTEIHDDGLVLRAYRLPPGVYTYSYPSRAGSIGEFSVRPALGYSAEQGETLGRSAAGHFTILPR